MFKSGINRELGISERFAAGSLAGAISQTAIYPMEVSITCDQFSRDLIKSSETGLLIHL